MKRKLKSIVSLRLPLAYIPSYHTVFEWEDILGQKLNLLNVCLKQIHLTFFRRLERLGLTNCYHYLLPKSKSLKIIFIMTATTKGNGMLDKNTIPVIVDFWLTEDLLQDFYKTYKFCPIVLITSAEVMSFLKEHNCPLPIEHWPLSLPDNIAVEEQAKQYDFCFIGRKDPFFVEKVERYANEHKDFEYVINVGDISKREYYTNKGRLISKDGCREAYLDIIKKSKICVYSTPGIDKAKDVKGRFNQVTPRLLELDVYKRQGRSQVLPSGRSGTTVGRPHQGTYPAGLEPDQNLIPRTGAHHGSTRHEVCSQTAPASGTGQIRARWRKMQRYMWQDTAD